MGLEAIFTLFGVILGFALTALWEAWTSARGAKQTRASVRSIVGAEIDHNIGVLTSIRDIYVVEKDKYQRTLEPDGAGGVHVEGNPIQVLKNSPFDSLSQDAWNSQLSQASSAFNAAEITAVFAFYGNLKWLLRAVDRFHASLVSGTVSRTYFVSSGFHADEVLTRLDIALSSRPKLE